MLLHVIERTTCELCQSQDLETLYQAPFHQADMRQFFQNYYSQDVSTLLPKDSLYSVVECQSCQLIFQRYILDPDSMAVFYDNIIDNEESFNKKSQAPFGYYQDTASSMNFIHALFPDKKPHEIKILDFGMGWGYWLSMARSFGFECAGAELSEKRIKFAQENGLRVITDLENTDETFDLIYTDQVFEHVDNLGHVLDLVLQKMNKGGYLRFAVPNGNNIREALQNPGFKIEKGPVQPLEHINCFSWPMLLRTMDKKGLRPVAAKDVTGLIHQLRAIKHLKLIQTPSWYFKKI